MSEGLTHPSYDPLPEEVASWLTAQGWHPGTQNHHVPVLWARGEQEVMQPMLREASDYDLRLSQMLRTLASWSERSVEALAEEMIHEGSDVAEWRAGGFGARDFSIPLEDGLDLVQAVRNAFVAAANATIQRRGYFGHSTLKVARDHARSIRMGQTRRGSYVIPIISRIPGANEQADEAQGRLDIEVSAQPFERRVMAQLAEALHTIETLAVRSNTEPSQRQLNESVGSGVSHELCAALERALATDSSGDVDVTFAWARRGARHPDVNRVEFPKAVRPVIHNMAERLRGSDVIAEQVLSGTIWQTKYERGEGQGFVKIRAQIGRSTRTVIVPLNDERMHTAYEAAAEDQPIYVRGQLVREVGRAWHFQSVSEFGVSEATPLSWTSGRNDSDDE